MTGANRLHKDVIALTYRYLGPAAERFVGRMVQSHLHKKPEQLTQQDMQDLITWFSLAMGFISGDPVVVNQYEAELKALQASHAKPQKAR